MSPDNQPNTTKICPTCGTRLGINATRCSVCGSNLAPSAAVSSAKAVSGPRIPEVTISLPVVFGLAVLLLIIGAGAVYAVLKSMGGQAPITAAAAATITPTHTATGTATMTPTASLTPSPSPTWTLEPPIEYKVAPGDLCSSIAGNFHVSIQSINEANGINCDILSAGQVLKIPRPTPTPLPSATPTLNPTEQAQAECSTVQVTVKAGDTLGGIAANYAVSANSIQAYNNKPNDTVYEGEKLTIPLCERQLETPSPTPVPPYAAPNLLLPADGASYVNLTDVITLQWSSVGTLRQNESYRVTIDDVTEGNARQLIQYVTETKLIVPENFRPLGTTPHILRWSVITVRQTGTDKDTGNPIWEPGGSVSVQRVFSWVGSGNPPPQPTETPKP
jgi:LysM repeat protein